jgi:hypothetical protein
LTVFSSEQGKVSAVNAKNPFDILTIGESNQYCIREVDVLVIILGQGVVDRGQVITRQWQQLKFTLVYRLQQCVAFFWKAAQQVARFSEYWPARKGFAYRQILCLSLATIMELVVWIE